MSNDIVVPTWDQCYSVPTNERTLLEKFVYRTCQLIDDVDEEKAFNEGLTELLNGGAK